MKCQKISREINCEEGGRAKVLLKKRRISSRKEGRSLQQKGSLTVESAAVLPVFLLAVLCLVSMMDLYRAEIILQSVLCETAKELGVYAYCAEDGSSSPIGAVTKAACIAYGTRRVREALEDENLIGIDQKQIFLLDSEYKDEKVSLNAVFFYRSPVPLFRSFPVKIQVLGQARAWTGYHGKKYGDGAEEMVYVTDWESVYHTSRDCTHIQLKIQAISAFHVYDRVNEYGNHYQACDKCCSGKDANGTVYITTSGDCYHRSRTCGGLTRHVHAVKKSETENMRVCTRCKGG